MEVQSNSPLVCTTSTEYLSLDSPSSCKVCFCIVSSESCTAEAAPQRSGKAVVLIEALKQFSCGSGRKLH